VKLVNFHTAEADVYGSALINNSINLTFICPCIANIFSEYNQQGATYRNK